VQRRAKSTLTQLFRDLGRNTALKVRIFQFVDKVRILQEKFCAHRANKDNRYQIVHYALTKEIGRLHMKFVKSKKSKQEKLLKSI
jgi:hypothetical protein